MGTGASWTSEPLEQAVRVAGLPQLHVSVAPSTPAGGAVFAELYDVFPDGRTMRLGWAAMDLRFHAGGNTEPQPLVPGQAVLAMMEFEPVDALVARGHRLALALHKNGVEDIEPSMTPDSLQVELGGGKSVLRLPVVERPTVLPTYTPPSLGDENRSRDRSDRPMPPRESLSARPGCGRPGIPCASPRSPWPRS